MTDPEPKAPARSPQEGLTLKELVQRLLRHWVLMLSVWFVVLLLVVIWTFVATPKYESTAVVRILDDPQEMGLAAQFGDMPGADFLGLGRDKLETEIGVLQSWRMAEAVVDSLALTVRLKRPAGVRSQVVEVLSQGDPDVEAEITLRRQAGGAYSVLIEEEDEEDRREGPIQPGQDVAFQGYTVRLAPEFPEDPPEKITIQIVPRYEAVEDLRDEVDIRRQEGGSRLVEVSLMHPDRTLAAAIVNGIVNQYVAYKTSVERAESRFTARELQEEVAGYGIRLQEAEERLRDYQEANQVVAPEEQATQQVKRYAEVLIQRDALEVERSSLARLLALVENRVHAGPEAPVDPAAYRQLATFPTLISNEAIQNLLMVLLEVENERSELLVLRQPENRDVRALTDRIRELESQLFHIGSDYLESLDGHLASVNATLDGIREEMEAFPEMEMEYLRLYRDREVLNEAYVMLQAQLQLTEVRDAIRDPGVRIVDMGLIAHEDDPEFPKPLVNILLGMVLAGALAVSAGLLRDFWEG